MPSSEIRVMISDEQIRDVVAAALLREMASVVSGETFNGALTDEAWECSERVVEAMDVEAGVAQLRRHT